MSFLRDLGFVYLVFKRGEYHFKVVPKMILLIRLKVFLC